MPRLHVRTLIGATSALVVVLVAACTLSLTLTVSLRTINTNGERAVRFQSSIAAQRADSVFAVARAGCEEVMSLGTTVAGMTVPTEDVTFGAEGSSVPGAPAGLMLQRYADAMHGVQRRSNFSIFWASAAFAGGGYIARTTHASFPGLLAEMQVNPFPNGTYEKHVTTFETRHGKALPATPGSPGAIFAGLVRAFLAATTNDDTSSWARYNRTHGISKVVTTVAPLMVLEGGEPTWFVTAGGPMKAGALELTGYVMLSLRINDISDRLRSARPTQGSHAFAVDQDGFLLASTDRLNPMTHFSEFVEGDEVPSGCTTTWHTKDIVTSTGKDGSPMATSMMGCREHVRRSTAMAGVLSKLVVANAGLLGAAHESPELQFVEAPKHYLAVQRLPSLADNALPLRLVAVMVVPRADILGDAGGILRMTVAVTCGVVAVVAVLSFGMVWAVLRPLGPIAVRMGRAARLEDDEPPASLSWLVEIADLQSAFNELTAELTRIRAFVPQALLRAGQVDEDCSQVTDPDMEPVGSDRATPSERRTKCASGTSPNSSATDSMFQRGVMRTQAYTHRTSASSHTNTPSAARQATVSVLCGNLVGFHDECRRHGGPSADATAAVVTVVLQVANEHRGVVDSFHGDRFVVTFNAVRPAVGHVSKSAICGAQLAVALPDTGDRLRATIGVATSLVHVGALGNSEMKRISVIGPALPQAAALERLCKMYGGSSCLVAQRSFEDLQTAVELLTLDLVRLPGVGRPSLIANVERILDACDQAPGDEWMYQLQQNGASSELLSTVGRLNGAWLKVARQDIAGATAMLQGAQAGATRNASDDVTPPGHASLALESGGRLAEVLGQAAGVDEAKVNHHSSFYQLAVANY